MVSDKWLNLILMIKNKIENWRQIIHLLVTAFISHPDRPKNKRKKRTGLITILLLFIADNFTLGF